MAVRMRPAGAPARLSAYAHGSRPMTRDAKVARFLWAVTAASAALLPVAPTDRSPQVTAQRSPTASSRFAYGEATRTHLAALHL